MPRGRASVQENQAGEDPQGTVQIEYESHSQSDHAGKNTRVPESEEEGKDGRAEKNPKYE